ncbi:TPA: hypothetical protein N0F65_002592 [Lagenidium giganteum]|uniref:Ribosome biogenesis protein NOP53 n=1 Tax=Lagenidium giganteum TaxID=4803 RepID=A0AAV2YW42_9STRA|nr:TPA: hypothetical protein N0F65_002592 [Lagenidium giganteum]
MGRRGSRIARRAQEIGAQVEESIRQDGEDQKLQHVDSSVLFQIDSKGGETRVSKKDKLKQLQKAPGVRSGKFVAEKANRFEQEKVKKLKEQTQPQKPIAKKRAAPAEALWGNDGKIDENPELKGVDEFVAPAVAKKIKRRNQVAPTLHKVKKVEVAAPGQSYHPEFESHQDVMAEAVAQELERQEMRKKMAEPVSKGLSKETLQYINDKDSDEESESEAEEETEEADSRKRSAPEQLTRAQRNKRARHKQMIAGNVSKKSEKALLGQINNVNVIMHEVLREEKVIEQKAEVKKLLKEQALEESPVARVAGKPTKIVREPAVLFKEELTGNLRTLKPKGNPLLDRFDSLHKRNMIEIGGANKTKKSKYKIIEKK